MAVSGGIELRERAAYHVVYSGFPLFPGSWTRGKEVLAVTHHTHLLCDLFARSGRIDLVVALVLNGLSRPVFHCGSAGRNDKGWGITCELSHRETCLGGIPGSQNEGLHIRLKMLRAGTDLIVAWKQGHGPKTARTRVHHVHDPLVDITKINLCRLKRLGGRDSPRQTRRPRDGRLQTDPRQGRHTYHHCHHTQPEASPRCRAHPNSCP